MLLGFALAFVRFWHLEAAGEWTAAAVVSSVLLAASVLVQLVTLFRSLDLKDIEPARYVVTIRWFQAGVVLLVVAVTISILAVS